MSWDQVSFDVGWYSWDRYTDEGNVVGMWVCHQGTMLKCTSNN